MSSGNPEQERRIPLGKGLFAIVDASDYELLSQFNWHSVTDKRGSTSYAMRKIWVGNGKMITCRMHRLILNIEDPKIKVDHRDLNGLNNRRENLRVCADYQNKGNTRKPRHGTTSKYKGVSWSKQRKLWISQIQTLGKRTVLGFFADESIAAQAYDAAAINNFGEFARINFPLDEGRR